MIITVKNLQQQTFTIEFDAEKTVLELKKRIFNERGSEYIVEKQKLIYAGVILTDDRTISSYKVDEKKFIVVMLTRDISGSSSNTAITTNPVGQQQQQLRELSKETAVKSSLSSSHGDETQSESEKKTADKAHGTSAEMAAATTTDKRTNEDSSIVSPPLVAAPTTDYSSIDLVGELANASLQNRAESNLLMGEEYNRTVASMVEMGYPRDQVERAMAASFNNPERAVEYLITGIPQDSNLFNAAGDEEDQSRASNLRPESLSDLQTESTADPFEFLRSQPQFLQMRSLIYQNPHLLHAVLQQIGQTNPALLQLISENQDAFLNMLNQPLEGEVGDNGQRTGRTQSSSRRTETLASLGLQDESATASVAEGQRSVAGAELNQPVNLASSDDVASTIGRDITVPQSENMATIRLTPQDQDAIERLKALGFSEALVLQAYFACEKNEQLAANFLLSSTFDD
ncbi:UV excision repair protein RAD23 homolog A [Drosophila innubila]|uniref:UV excision repair protein RAD23 homolog A n=1 Tax=Drosophila innubila TaxID=198719 RepID=UPI00148DE575|nr:UV excision repair protein RAD23 homolog A [Drosophila innubila]